MTNKKIKINEERAVFLDIRSAVSIAMFDVELDNLDESIDTDVRRAVMYNKIVFENMVKRLFSYCASRENKKNQPVSCSIVKLLKQDAENTKEKLYVIENPTPESFMFLSDILDKKKKVRGYSEYILYSLFNHYYDYIKN